MIFSGVSITGPNHIKNNKKNEDSILIRRYNSGLVLAISDGFGSVKEARLGSQAAVWSVHKAFLIWRTFHIKKIEYLIQLIHNLWEQKILPEKPSDCNATCLFCITLNSSNMIMGQLGDGMILVSNKEKILHRLITEKDFGNQTNGMGNTTSLKSWNWIETLYQKDQSILLCTDGISDDIEETKEFYFHQYLLNELKSMNVRKRNLFLKQELKNWPVPYHSDDKTLGLCWTE